MIGTIARVGWALEARGLEPAAKLVLVLAANAADMDGRAFNIDKLREQANLTEAGFKDAVDELTDAGFAGLGLAIHPADGDKRRCLQLFIDGGDA